jgi:hypothetical protein
MHTKSSDPNQQNISDAKPYAPSFLDRFMCLFQRLPTPYWLTYLIFFILQSAIFHGLAWIDGWLPVYTFNLVLFLFPLWLWGPMAIITYLNLTSEAALSSFSPLLHIEEEGLKRLKCEFTTMPTRGVILSSVIWAIVYVILINWTFDVFYGLYGFGKFFAMIIFLEGLISYSTGSAIYYHSFRQLWLVNRTVKMVKKFNLFQLDPIYALSRLTSRTGISWIFMLGLTLLMYPLELAKGAALVILVIQVTLALAAFILPLRLVNHNLVTEKRELLKELNQRVESTLERLHRCIDEGQLSDADQLNKTIMSLNAERDILKSIPTWPWSSGTLTGFLSALVLPIILFLIQIVIQSWLGG